MASRRTQIICLCEGTKGGSIDEVFINRLIRSIKPGWLRQGSNGLVLVSCGGRTQVIEDMPKELEKCLSAGGETTLMVWADCDDNCNDGEALKHKFWTQAKQCGISTVRTSIALCSSSPRTGWRTGSSSFRQEPPTKRERGGENATTARCAMRRRSWQSCAWLESR